jgi:hypothetical protein
MRARGRLVAGIVMACAFACALPPGALAARTMPTVMMDDQQLVYSTPLTLKQTFAQMSALGVQQIKVTLVWSLVAPDPDSTRHPLFDAADPNAYPPFAWSRYDAIVRIAQAAGIKVFFQIDGAAPLWAIPAGEPQQSEQRGRAPDPSDFEQFVQAAGRRYSGSFVPADTEALGLGGVLQDLLGGGAPASGPLPRVSMWSVWNEPNVQGTLNPWWQALGGGRTELLAPSLYRGLLDAAWNGLAATGHTPATDTILIGETSNPGDVTIVPFVRDLYCLSAKLRLLRGPAAQLVGCPTSGSRASFVRANPALFYASGFAHHPYSYNVAPGVPYPVPGWITMYNLGSFEHLLGRIFASYGKLPRGGEIPLYLSEFGYESNPPNPFVKNTLAQQATWLNAAEYMAWRDPYVQDQVQFELVDSVPDLAEPVGSLAYWTRSYQTGLEFLGGAPKPALDAYRLPIWLPVPRHGPNVAVWGQLRPAEHAGLQAATLQYAPRESNNWSSLGLVSTSNADGFFLAHAAIPAAGSVRIGWTAPGGQVFYSRAATVR